MDITGLRRVPDDAYVVMPNQLGIDAFDLDDAFTMQENHMCSSDMREFIANHHLNLSMDGTLNPREALAAMTMQIMCTIHRVRGICCAA